MKEPAKRILGIVLLAAALWPLFYKLGEAPLRAWDESLFAMRAYYAVEEGGYLPNFDYYPGITFYRNLKPPFGTWWQALSYRMFGYDEWALRLPVAVFSALLVVMLWLWRCAVPELPYSGVAAGLILVLSPGFLRDHVARTGDHDAILLLVMTALASHFRHSAVLSAASLPVSYTGSIFGSSASAFTKSFLAAKPWAALRILSASAASAFTAAACGCTLSIFTFSS